jgi:hypothetical protein
VVISSGDKDVQVPIRPAVRKLLCGQMPHISLLVACRASAVTSRST